MASIILRNFANFARQNTWRSSVASQLPARLRGDGGLGALEAGGGEPRRGVEGEGRAPAQRLRRAPGRAERPDLGVRQAPAGFRIQKKNRQ